MTPEHISRIVVDGEIIERTISEVAVGSAFAVTGLIVAGSNITFTGAGTIASPYVIASTGGVSDGDKGDITVSASGATWSIDNGAVTLSKLADLASAHIIGRHGGGTGTPQSIAISGGLTLSGANLQRAALTGDVTASAGNNSTTIANGAVTNAKLANMTANTVKVRAASTNGAPSDLAVAASRLVGRGSTGNVAEISLGSRLVMSGTVLNVASVIVRSGTDSPPNMPRVIRVQNVSSPPEYNDFSVTFDSIDGDGFPVWVGGGSTEIKVVNGLWVIIGGTTLFTKPYGGELSPIGLTDWTEEDGAGSITVSVDDQITTVDPIMTPGTAGEIVRYGSAPYRYFIANSTTAGDYRELTEPPQKYLTLAAGATIAAWMDGIVIRYNSSSAANFELPSSIAPPVEIIIEQVSTGAATFTAGSGATRNAEGDAFTTAAQHATIFARNRGAVWTVIGGVE